MAERPILMSGPMVRAVLEGRKSQTRRLVKPQPPRDCKSVYAPFAKDPNNWQGVCADDLIGWYGRCPYGVPGDRLWVREKHYRMGKWVRSGTTKAGRPRWRFKADGNGLLYVAQVEDTTAPIVLPKKRTERGWHKRPSIFMPRWACRLVLEVTAVRVERLQDISEGDSKAEGCAVGDVVTHKGTMGPFDAELTKGADTAREAYRALWNSLNAKRAPWASNPWVWCISFRRVT